MSAVCYCLEWYAVITLVMILQPIVCRPMAVHVTIRFNHYKYTLIFCCGVDKVNCRFSQSWIRIVMWIPQFQKGLTYCDSVFCIKYFNLIVECDPDQDEAIMKIE